MRRMVSLQGDLCYQLMECTDRARLDEWMRRWEDLVDFEVVPVITSGEAVKKVSLDEPPT